jgi:hypothetical protein
MHIDEAAPRRTPGIDYLDIRGLFAVGLRSVDVTPSAIQISRLIAIAGGINDPTAVIYHLHRESDPPAQQ